MEKPNLQAQGQILLEFILVFSILIALFIGFCHIFQQGSMSLEQKRFYTKEIK